MRAVATPSVRHARRRPKLGGGGAGIDPERSQVDEREARTHVRGKATSRSNTLWQLCTETTTQSAVEFFIKMISRKYEIQKQVIVEDADLEKSGRVLNRVIECGRDGTTAEADQGHVREILIDF